MKTQIMKTDKGMIEYSKYGNGNPLLVIHGGHSNAQELIIHKGLSPDDFTLITPSRPGYGKTPLERNVNPIKSARLIVEMMKELGFQQFDILAVSAGGPTALALASIYPDKVKRMILASAVTKKWLSQDDSTYKKAKVIFNPLTEKFTWAVLRMMLSLFPKATAKLMIKEFSSIESFAIGKDEIVDLSEMLINQSSGKGFMADLNHDVNPYQLSNITAETLIVHSVYDKTVSIDHARLAHSAIKNSTLMEVENRWGHMLWIGDDTQAVRNKMALFLKSA